MLSDLYDLSWRGAAHRTVRNTAFAEWETAGRPGSGQRRGEGTFIGSRRRMSGDVQDRPRHAVGIIPPTFDGDMQRVPMFMGEACRVVNDIASGNDRRGPGSRRRGFLGRDAHRLNDVYNSCVA